MDTSEWRHRYVRHGMEAPACRHAIRHAAGCPPWEHEGHERTVYRALRSVVFLIIIQFILYKVSQFHTSLSLSSCSLSLFSLSELTLSISILSLQAHALHLSSL